MPPATPASAPLTIMAVRLARATFIRPETRAAFGEAPAARSRKPDAVRPRNHQAPAAAMSAARRPAWSRASAFVHERLRDVAARGAAVVVHMSDLDELLSLATRMIVAFHGTVRAVPPVRDAVGRAMLGGE